MPILYLADEGDLGSRDVTRKATLTDQCNVQQCVPSERRRAYTWVPGPAKF